MEGNHVFINVSICKKLIVRPEVYCYFLADFDQGKSMHNFVTDHMQCNVRKHSQLLRVGNFISFNFDLKTRCEISEGCH